jgi:hypothetical protein
VHGCSYNVGMDGPDEQVAEAFSGELHLETLPEFADPRIGRRVWRLKDPLPMVFAARSPRLLASEAEVATAIRAVSGQGHEALLAVEPFPLYSSCMCPEPSR